MGPEWRTDDEQRLLEKANRYLPGGSLGNIYWDSDHAFLVHSGKGSKIYDVSGHEYIDYLLGSGPMILGHAHPKVVSAVKDSITRGSTFFATNAVAVELAEQVVNAVPCAEMVRFTTSGTDACFQSLRLARAYRKRDRILKFEGGFHGTSDYAVMGVNPKVPLDYPHATTDSAGVPGCLTESVLVAPFNDLGTTSSIIEQYHDELAAVIIEPLQRILVPEEGFLQGLRSITEHFGIPLIFDEVVTGFRLAWGGAQEYYGVIPDLAAFGKIVGGGLPLALICGKEEILSGYDLERRKTQGFIPQIGTLNGNPLAASAGLATLLELKKPGMYEALRQTGATLRQILNESLDKGNVPYQVIGDDTVFDVVFTDSPVRDYRSLSKGNSRLMTRFNNLLLESGILKGTQKFYSGLCHTPEDLKKTTEVLNYTIERLYED